MEKILSEFSAEGLEIKLTDEKLFINTATTNETFALRSVNGIGVIDLVDDYNSALSTWKAEKGTPIVLIVVGALLLLIGLSMLTDPDSKSGAWLELLFGGIPVVAGIIMLNSLRKMPTMLSAVRIMMSGGNRDFKFDKKGVIVGDIAGFVLNVEATLTAYHKNKD
jgi:hypothetical protein